MQPTTQLTIRKGHVILVKYVLCARFFLYHSDKTIFTIFIGYNVRVFSGCYLVYVPHCIAVRFFCAAFIYLLIISIEEKGTFFDDHTFMWDTSKPKRTRGVQRRKKTWRPNEK